MSSFGTADSDFIEKSESRWRLATSASAFFFADAILQLKFYKFIFLARSWAADRAHLAESLDALGKNAEQEDRPFCFLLYPEGTLVSQNTRPVSKKFADKIGVVRAQ